MIVAVDMGASSSRFCSDTGKVRVIPNNMVFLPSLDTTTLQAEPGDIENNLEIQIIKKDGKAPNGCFPANVLVGFMATRHKDISERPSVQMHKHDQNINYVSAVVCTALEVERSGADGAVVDLYLAVPPIEVIKADEKFKEGLIGKYEVKFPKYKGGVTVNFEIADVSCSEESLMATTSFFFDLNGRIRDNARQYLKGKVLSLDIGASTTDLAIIQDGKYLDKSGRTYRIGGNIARDTLNNLICERYAIDLPIEDCEKTIAEGRMQFGNSFENVADLVDESKRTLAKQIVQHMQTYFRNIDIPIQMVNSIIVSGGGSVASQYIDENGEAVITSAPMSEYVTEELQKWSPRTAVIEYGDEARFANIKGLFIRAMLSNKKKQAKAAEAGKTINVSSAVTTNKTTEVASTGTPISGVASAGSSDTVVL